jgi:hypothetical protein
MIGIDISPTACRVMAKRLSGKPTVATVPPSFTVRLAAMGSGLKQVDAAVKLAKIGKSEWV